METKNKSARILLVEDSAFYSAVLCEQLKKIPNLTVDSAATRKEGQYFLDTHGNDYDLALVDLALPDAPNGEFVECALMSAVPTIIFSSNFDPELKAKLFAKGIIDYVIKDSPVAIDYLIELITFLLFQSGQKALVASSDKALKRQQVHLLSNLKMEAWACDSAADAKKLLARHHDFTLALIGDTLKDCTGIELVGALRRSHTAAQLSILAIPDDSRYASQYLRYGANDFLRQPYSPEEFQCRVLNAVKSKRHLHSLETAATRDFLTGQLNRRAFFEAATPIVAHAKRARHPLALVMVDIDHFKKINDRYGHAVGDTALKIIAATLRNELRETDIIARFGGEEFCILMPDINEIELPTVLDRFLKAMRSISIPHARGFTGVTASFGSARHADIGLEQLIKLADDALYDAKHRGRDRFIVSKMPYSSDVQHGIA